MTREELKGELIKNQVGIVGQDGVYYKCLLIDDVLRIFNDYTKPKTKTKPLENRKDEFELKCLVVAKGDELNFLKDFVDYWTEHNEGGKKMRFEMSKNQPFNIKRRLATWKKNQKNYGTTTTKKGIDSDSLDGWINS